MNGKAILILGPESTGKSTLTRDLQQYYQQKGIRSVAVFEYARDWIDKNLDGNMEKLAFEHITHFGVTQWELTKKVTKNYDLVFSDTDAVTSLIFQRIYFGQVDQRLVEMANQEKWDGVLWTQIDVPWVEDGQRNLSNRRQEISNMFEIEIKKRNFHYQKIEGNWKQRFQLATKFIDSL